MGARFPWVECGHRLSMVLAGGIVAAGGALAALGGPEGTRVVHGRADMSQQGNETIIRTSRRAILNHTAFDIAANETVRFAQPDAASRVLNRITGPRPTLIEGQLLSNGKLYFVNPHGIYFAGSAVVDVGGLYAAAGQMSNEDFLAGIDRFTNLSGSVINEGQISGQQVHLVGQHVFNGGTIQTPRGLLTMVAGQNVYLAQIGERISVQVDSSNLQVTDGQGQAAVENSGTLSAPGGKITLGAGDMYSLAIRNRGLIAARGGEVALSAAGGTVQNSGTISVSNGGAAGKVLVEGQRIEQNGRIEADSASGAGGDVRLLAQQQLVLTPGSELSATGGTTGGFIEVCGHEADLGGTFALDGGSADGSLLIDPAQIIVDGALAATLAGTSGAITLAADDSIVIQAPVNLLNNNDFTLTTTTGPITFHADLTGARNLLVDSGGGIVFDGLEQQIQSSRRQVYNDPVQVINYTAFTASGVTFKGTVEGPGAVWVSGSVDFLAPVGATTRLADVHVTGTANIGGGIAGPGGVTIATVGGQYYMGNVNLLDHALLRGSQVIFEKEIDDGRAGTTPGEEANLVIDGQAFFNSRVTFATPEELPNRLVGSVRVTGETIIAGGYITTAREQTYEGAVTISNQDARLTSLGGDIRFLGAVDAGAFSEGEAGPGLTVDARRGHIQFGGDVGGEHVLGFLTAKAGVNYGKVITINGQSITADGDIQFNPDGVEFVPDVATIAAPDGGVSIRSLDGRVVMGQNNKLTALGNLNIQAAERAVLGDLNAFGDIAVTAPTIELLTRSAGNVLESDGVRRPDGGVDIVAQGELGFDGDVVASGGRAAPRFGSSLETADALGSLGDFDVVQIAPLTAEQFFYAAPEAAPIVLDLRIVPLGVGELASAMFRGPLPFADRMVREPLLGPEGQTRLGRLAVNLRAPTASEQQQLLSRSQFFSDLLGLFEVSETAQVRPVALNRIPRQLALEALDGFDALFVAESVDEATGQQVITDQAPAIREALAGAWEKYRSQAAAPSAEGFAEFLGALPADDAAHQFGQRLGEVLAAVEAVGLNALESQSADGAILGPVTPRGVEPALLREALRQLRREAAEQGRKAS